MARPGRPNKKRTESARGLGGDEKAQKEAERLEMMMNVNMADFFEPGSTIMKSLSSLPTHVVDCVKKIRFDTRNNPILELYDRTSLLNAWMNITGRRADKEDKVHKVIFDTSRAGDAEAGSGEE